MTRPLVVAIASVGGALLAIGLACGDREIPIATTTVSVDAGHVRCVIEDVGDGGAHCEAGQFCSRNTCTSNDGLCEDIPSQGCESDSGPQCGCDGISYYNSCVRQQAQIGLASSQACGVGMLIACADPRCKPRNAGCAVVFPGSGQVDFKRLFCPSMTMPSFADTFDAALPPTFVACWALPDGCRSSGSQLVQSCEGKCVDECEAIKDGGFFFPCVDAGPFH